MLISFRLHHIDALITVGGDGSLAIASVLAKRGMRLISVPKTIDNDLPLPGSTPTFGYETARHNGVYIVRNLMEDARTTGRWYIIGASWS